MWFVIFVAATALVPLGSRADELKLKDGTKIVGAIVGFEENSFKVKTSFGIAIVLKDQVASISMSDAPKLPADKQSDPAAVLRNPEPPKTTKIDTSTAPEHSGKPKPTTPPASAPATTKQDVLPTTATPADPPDQPASPEPIREQVVGNTYTNETYGFQMYKPPAWQVIAGVPSLLPGAVSAMGTNDQTTYLLVGQEVAGKSLESTRDATQRRLRNILENFRPVGESSMMISGAPAIEIRFRGSVEEHDWSGAAVFVAHGTRLFTIFGMTLADSDLVQIQENVIARAISSLQFTK